MRSVLNPDRRKGDAAKNSARFPLRRVFRSHSSAATTTAVLRPFRVMVWGPRDRALSRTSLNFAFAWATVQVSTPTVQSPYRKVIVVIIVILMQEDNLSRSFSVITLRNAGASSLSVAETERRPYSCGAVQRPVYSSGVSDGSRTVAGRFSPVRWIIPVSSMIKLHEQWLGHGPAGRALRV